MASRRSPFRREAVSLEAYKVARPMMQGIKMALAHASKSHGTEMMGLSTTFIIERRGMNIIGVFVS